MSGVSSLSDGEYLLPSIVDKRAAEEPSATWALSPWSTSSYDEGFREITIKDLANAVNGAAWWIKKQLGISTNYDTLAYIGPSDIRYAVFVIASIKAGYKLLLTSPRNDTAAHVNLFKLLDCKTLISTENGTPAIKSIVSTYTIDILSPPSISDLFDQTHEHFAYDKKYVTIKDKPMFVLHTSGSTGLPKPIIAPNSFLESLEAMVLAEPPQGYVSELQRLHGRRVFSPFPFFHAAGIYFNLCSSVLLKTVPILPITGVPPTGQGAIEALRKAPADAAMFTPKTLEEIGKTPGLLSGLASKVDCVAYMGGDLPKLIGDAIASKVHLANIYGATEFVHAMQIAAKDKPWTEWKYVQFDERWTSEYQLQSDDMYELVLKKSPRSKCSPACFELFPDIEEYRTKDLWSPHPSKPGMWIYRERADNIIVFLNGEKVNPISFEGAIQSHSDVKFALLHGSQREHAVLLIELSSGDAGSTENQAAIIENIWPTIQTANMEVQSYARITKSTILFTTPDKPMIETSKSTVVRKATNALYATEIEKLYQEIKEHSNSTGGVTKEEKDAVLKDIESFLSYIQQNVHSILGTNSITRSDNLFLSGMDSVLGMQLVRAVNKIIPVSLSTVYSNPSVSQLGQALFSPGGVPTKSFAEISNEVLGKYKDTLKATIPRSSIHPPSTPPANKHVVLLTGSTGNLGNYLLATLLSLSSVEHVYCLNRSPTAANAHVTALKDRGLSTELPNSRVTFLTGNACDNSELGLPAEQVSKLSSTVTHILHNAWPVNFNLDLASFGPHLNGIINLLSFAAGAVYGPTLFFVSSIASIQSSPGPAVPERVIPSAESPVPNGYGQSKWVGEMLLEQAARELGMDTRVVRLGQVAGPMEGNGVWNVREWLPSLVMSSKTLGVVPDRFPAMDGKLGNESRGEVDWVPVDVVAAVIVQLLFAEEYLHEDHHSHGAPMYHISNPKTLPWAGLVPEVARLLSDQSKSPVKVVPYNEWVDALKTSAKALEEGADIESVAKYNPAVKLVSFYEDLGQGVKECGKSLSYLETEQTKKISSKLAEQGQISRELIGKWTKAWLEYLQGDAAK